MIAPSQLDLFKVPLPPAPKELLTSPRATEADAFNFYENQEGVKKFSVKLSAPAEILLEPLKGLCRSVLGRNKLKGPSLRKLPLFGAHVGSP